MWRVAVLGLAVLLICQGAGGAVWAQSPIQVRFEVGQVWRFKGRAADPDPTLVIVALDDDAVLGKLVHVSISGISVRNPIAASGVLDTVAHLPFLEDAVQRSVSELVATVSALPDFEEGYWTWRRAFDKGEAGVFDISVGEAVDVIEYGLNE